MIVGFELASVRNEIFSCHNQRSILAFAPSFTSGIALAGSTGADRCIA
jgi:hypothetical protein